MSKFIELHDEEGTTRLVNLDYVEEIWSHDDNAVLYFAFNCPDAIQQDSLRTIESYEDIKRKIDEVSK